MKRLTLAISCLLSTSAFAAPEKKDFDSKGISEVVVENTSGKLTITAEEGAKAVVLATKNKFSDKCKMSVDKSGNKLILKVETSSSFFTKVECDVDFEVKVPKSVDLMLTVGSGKVTIKGITGALNFKIGSGNIVADGSFHKIDGMCGSGRIEVKGLTGGGELKTGSGGMALTFLKGALKGELAIKAGSGDVSVLFPKGSKIKTSFHAGSGELSNVLGDTSNAPFLVSMKAGSGNLKIESY
jgi:DUF4097 and DUF4098 domain-containing protein YvlB